MQITKNLITVNKPSRVLNMVCIILILISVSGIIRGVNNIVFADTKFIFFTMGIRLFHGILSLFSQHLPVDKVLDGLTLQITPETIRLFGIAMFISNTILLAGSLMMRKLRKIGFYLYLVGSIFLIISPLFIFNAGFGRFSSTALMLFFGTIGLILFKRLHEMT